MRERQVLRWYAAQWRELRGGPVSGGSAAYVWKPREKYADARGCSVIWEDPRHRL